MDKNAVYRSLDVEHVLDHGSGIFLSETSFDGGRNRSSIFLQRCKTVSSETRPQRDMVKQDLILRERSQRGISLRLDS